MKHGLHVLPCPSRPLRYFFEAFDVAASAESGGWGGGGALQ